MKKLFVCLMAAALGVATLYICLLYTSRCV